MYLPRYVIALLLGCVAPAVWSEPTADPSGGMSEASSLSLEGSMVLAEGVLVGSRYVLVSLEPLGDGVLAVFAAAGESTRVTLELSGELAEFAGKQIGAVVEVSAEAGGSALLLAGEMIAFVPDELSRSLHHRKRLTP